MAESRWNVRWRVGAHVAAVAEGAGRAWGGCERGRPWAQREVRGSAHANISLILLRASSQLQGQGPSGGTPARPEHHLKCLDLEHNAGRLRLQEGTHERHRAWDRAQRAWRRYRGAVLCGGVARFATGVTMWRQTHHVDLRERARHARAGSAESAVTQGSEVECLQSTRTKLSAYAPRFLRTESRDSRRCRLMTAGGV